MPEVMTAVDDLFDSPAFGEQLTEWQNSRLRTLEADKLLDNALTGWFDNPDKTKSQIELDVSYYLELDEESFEHFKDMFDAPIAELQERRIEARAKESEEKDKLLSVSTDLGADQFALHGLWLHTRTHLPPTASELRQGVKSAVDDFEQVDQLVRANAGRVLTVVNMYAQSTRLGEGGININGNKKIVFPQHPTTDTFYVSPFMNDDETLLGSSEKPMTIDDHNIHSLVRNKAIRTCDNWTDWLQRLEMIHGVEGTTFILGDVTEGPPNIAAKDRRDFDFYQQAYNRIRVIGQAAGRGYLLVRV